MTQTLRELMTPQPMILDASATVAEAAQYMRDEDVGDVLVQDDGELCGIVTDRDIVVRCIAEDEDPSSSRLGDLCSEELVTLEVDASIDDAVTLMATHAVRSVPVVEKGAVLGILSLSDLALAYDPD